MKDYRKQMKDLAFTREQKDAMVEDLLAAAQPEVRRVPRRRLIAVAAALALTITACAAGGFQALSVVFATIFDPYPTDAQTLAIEENFTPIGVSDTDNGVTVTAEGVIGDAHSVSVLYSIQRDSGEPLIPPSEETSRVSNGDNFLFFETDTANELTDALVSGVGSIEFLDFDVADPTLYFLEIWTFPSAQEPLGGQMEVTFENLYSEEMYPTVSGEWVQNQIPLVQGTWNLFFDLAYEDSSIPLPVGQTFHYEELTGTITELRLSPLSIYLEYDYTVDMEALAAGYDPATGFPDDIENWLKTEKAILAADSSLYLNLNFTDGTSTPLFVNGDLTQDGHAFFSGTFEDIHPLDTIESVTLADLTIPVEAP